MQDLEAIKKRNDPPPSLDEIKTFLEGRKKEIADWVPHGDLLEAYEDVLSFIGTGKGNW